MSTPEVIESVAALRACVRNWRAAGETLALVPTMGALHAGHISLTQIARAKAQWVVVSIFVNPTQFGPNEDFSKYPRTFDADREKLQEAGVDAIWLPSVAEMYPPGFSTTVSLSGPASAGLEDTFRPGHFAGVATVVAKLHNQVQPDLAVYGEKDFQQLAVIRQLARDLDQPLQILGGETIREADGLALSSRNVYLGDAERRVAPMLNATMREAATRIRAGENFETVLAGGRAAIGAAGFALDYLELRDAMTLGAPDIASGKPLRMLVAAKIGATRLIDNIAV